MKVVIAGGRDFVGKEYHKKWLIEKLTELEATEVVSGKATGADSFGEEVASSLKLPVQPFPANWDDLSEPCALKTNSKGKDYNALAGHKRNEEMAKYADAVILFPGGTGTANMKKLASQYDLPTYEWKYSFSPVGDFKRKILIINEKPTKKEYETKDRFCGEPSKFLIDSLSKVGIDMERDCIHINVLDYFVNKVSLKLIHEKAEEINDFVKELKPKQVLVIGENSLNCLIGHRCTGRLKVTGFEKWAGQVIPDQELQCFILPIEKPIKLLQMLYDRRSRLTEYENNWKERCKKYGWTYRYKYYKPFYGKSYEDPQLISNDDYIIHNRFFMRHLKNATHDRAFYINNYMSEGEVILDIEEGIKALRYFLNQKTVAFDYETTGLKPHYSWHKIVSIGLSDGVRTVGMPFFEDEKFRALVKRFLRDVRIKKIIFNKSFEEAWTLNKLGYQILGIHFDPHLASWVLYNNKGANSLKFLTYTHFGILAYDDSADKYLNAPKKERDKFGSNAKNNIEEFDIKENAKYVGLDSFFTLKLYEDLYPKIESDPHLVNGYNFLHRVTTTIVEMQETGVRVNLETLYKHEQALEKEILKLKSEINDLPETRKWYDREGEIEPFNWRSSKQLGELLYGILEYEALKKTSKPPDAKTDYDKKWMGKSTDAESLQHISFTTESKLCETILRIKQLDKIKNTFLGGIKKETHMETGILHPFFHVNTVATYRLSSSNINFQNLTKHNEEAMRYIRSVFEAPPGQFLVEFDMGQFEFRVAAVVSQDPVMLEYTRDDTTDVHKDTTMKLFFLEPEEVTKNVRGIVKNQFVFLNLYGGGAKKTAQSLWYHMTTPGSKKFKKEEKILLIERLAKYGIKDYDSFLAHTKKIMDWLWKERFKVYDAWRDSNFSLYKRKGHISLYSGFKCGQSTPLNSRQTSNYCIQGFATHVLMSALMDLNDWLNLYCMKSKVIASIHDSILMFMEPSEFEKIKDKVRYLLTEKTKLDYPVINTLLKVEYDQYKENWAVLDKEKSGVL